MSLRAIPECLARRCDRPEMKTFIANLAARPADPGRSLTLTAMMVPNRVLVLLGVVWSCAPAQAGVADAAGSCCKGAAAGAGKRGKG